jgi:hypothetical protein
MRTAPFALAAALALAGRAALPAAAGFAPQGAAVIRPLARLRQVLVGTS